MAGVEGYGPAAPIAFILIYAVAASRWHACRASPRSTARCARRDAASC